MRAVKENHSTSGFTLIEMVTAIVLLGIVSVGISGVLNIGTQIFVDVTSRDEIISTARFAVERLNRELRTSLPNSVIVVDDNKCLKYTPIITSFVYLDIPVAPEAAAKTIKLVGNAADFSKVQIGSDNSVAVYPLRPQDVYDNDTDKVFVLNSLSNTGAGDNQWDISFSNDVLFGEDSPTNRLYFIGDEVKYCLEGRQLVRYVGAGNGVLMADDIFESNFTVDDPTLNRNATVLITFTFERNFEYVTFSNEVQIPNVP
ncbi:MAG: type II secretion system protein [Alteromonadaceae bacterium]|nr:type II secretion system protein [Alteromonadaceae bacterium]